MISTISHIPLINKSEKLSRNVAFLLTLTSYTVKYYKLFMFTSKERKLAQVKAKSGILKTGSFDFNNIASFFTLSSNKDFYQVISDRTFQDLDMDEVFMFLDRTTSKVGQQVLYRVLRTIPESQNRIDRFEQINRILNKHSGLGEKILSELTTLQDKNAYYIPSLFLERHIQKPKWFWVIPVLSLTSLITLTLSFFFPQLLIFLVLLLGLNFGIHYWNKINVYQYSSSITQLLKLTLAAKRIAVLDGIREMDLDIMASIRSIDNLGIQMSLFKLEVKLQSETGQAVEYFVELIKALFLIEPLILYNVLQKMDEKRQDIKRIYEYVGEIDVAISIGFLRESLPFHCIPVITADRKQLTAAMAYHPLIYNSVPNSLDLNQKSVLLTGSNMSGKTTFIRTIGINAISAQTINICFAEAFSIPRLKVHSAIRISDDLLNDKSYYFEEVLTIKSLLSESRSGNSNLFLIDELFKGTNTVERIASGKAVLSYLNEGNNITMVATHDLELGELLNDTFSLFHFSEIVEDGKILFDYKIKPGNLNKTNAIRILELNDYPPEVTTEASLLAREILISKLKIN